MTHLFVYAMPRSGGGLLLRLLNSIPNVTLGGEKYGLVHVLTTWWEYMKTKEHASSWETGRYCPNNWQCCDDSKIIADCRQLILDLMPQAEISGFKEIIGQDTTKGLIDELGFLKATFPDCKFLFLIREKWGAYLSMEKLNWKPDLEKIANWIDVMLEVSKTENIPIIDYDDLRKYDKFSEWIGKLGLAVPELTYRELCAVKAP